MQLRSIAFDAGTQIPRKYTCDGDNVSPPLAMEAVPGGTKSLALVMRDPDAPGGVFVHWVLFNVPPETASLPEAVPRVQKLDDGSRQGTNDFGNIGYGGPCPPKGRRHTYRLSLYALDRMLDVEPGATWEELREALDETTLGSAELAAPYQRHQ